MENLTPNGLGRQSCGNGLCTDEGRLTRARRGTSPQIHDPLAVNNVPKSRSNECWNMLSPDEVEKNNNNYFERGIFPKSMTSGKMTSPIRNFPEYHENRTLRGPILQSGRWPDSLEDPERETTRSSSNPGISTSISDDDFTDKRINECSLQSSLEHRRHQNLETMQKDTDTLSDDDVSSRKVFDRVQHPTDSLPRHRERLSQCGRKKGVRMRRDFLLTTARSHDQLRTTANDTASNSSLMTSRDDVRCSGLFMHKICGNSEGRLESLQREETTTFPYRPNPSKTPLKFCDHDQNGNSLAHVGSWLANHSFSDNERLTTPHTPYYSLQSMSNLNARWSEKCAVHQMNEIHFGPATPRDVTFNVSGQRYMIDPVILSRFPETLLGSEEKRRKFWDERRKEYFLDRHRATFEVVMEYYKSGGTLNRPDDIPIDIFIHEIRFYCLDRENIHNFLSNEGILLVVKEKPMPEGAVKRFVWQLFEDPESSLTARMVTSLSAIVIAISVIVFCMETVPAFESLSETSLKHIGSALNICEWSLATDDKLFSPHGGLYAPRPIATQYNLTTQRVNKTASALTEDAKDKMPYFEKYYWMKDTVTGEKKRNSMIDLFDTSVLITTIQRTLEQCVKVKNDELIYIYTIMRCQIELNDALSYEEATPIHHILKRVEVHPEGHHHDNIGQPDDTSQAEAGHQNKENSVIAEFVGKENKNKQIEMLSNENIENNSLEDKGVNDVSERSSHGRRHSPTLSDKVRSRGKKQNKRQDKTNKQFRRHEDTTQKEIHGDVQRQKDVQKQMEKREILKRDGDDTLENSNRYGYTEEGYQYRKNEELPSRKRKYMKPLMTSSKWEDHLKWHDKDLQKKIPRRRNLQEEDLLHEKEERLISNQEENNISKGDSNLVDKPKSEEDSLEKAEEKYIQSNKINQRKATEKQKEQKPKKKKNLHDNDRENITKKRLTLRQSIIALNHVCPKLDNESIRSSYGWFVLEASLGGAAGQLFLIESGCIVWFVIELGLRFFCCPDKVKFCTNFLNIIDAVAIMPYFITLIVTSMHTNSNIRPQTATILRTIRLVRMLRILKLSRHSRGLRILGLTLVRSTRVLVLLICFQMVLAVTFSSIVYYVEYDAKDTQFKSIPGTFWWAIITMTTVGYGDVVPITTWGKITGAFCAIMGILGIAFPVPVIVSNFNYLYNLDSDACKLTVDELIGDTDVNENMDKFQENLFDAVRRNVGSMTSGPAESQPTGQNPAELWNYTRRQYHDKKQVKPIPDAAKSHKFTKGLVAMATASALTMSLPESTTLSKSEGRRRKATSI